LRLCVSLKPDIIFLDVTLPDMKVGDTIRSLRQWCQTPIIILSECSEDVEIAGALNLGANDYIIKPFNIDVLLARMNAALRSSCVRTAGEPLLINGHLTIDLVRHEVYAKGTPLALTPKEYELLRYFMLNCGKMLLHKDILKNVWGAGHTEDTSYVRVYVGQLRAKIETAESAAPYITTEPGIGYRMETISAASVADIFTKKYAPRPIPCRFFIAAFLWWRVWREETFMKHTFNILLSLAFLLLVSACAYMYKGHDANDKVPQKEVNCRRHLCSTM
jgi:two-component system, OmpR family, KDP operon response regulator KdpE